MIGAFVHELLPAMPGPLFDSSATDTGNAVCIVGGGASGPEQDAAAWVFWKLKLDEDMPHWQSLQWLEGIPVRFPCDRGADERGDPLPMPDRWVVR